MATKKPMSMFKKAIEASGLKTNDIKGKKDSLRGVRPAAASSTRKPKPRSGPRNRIKNRSGRGVVFLSHLPHGFYEDQIKEYFSQFGSVTGVKVVRSEKTGGSKGYGYVQFVDREVAEIAADTMNMYLMTNRIINASLLTPKKGNKINFVDQKGETKRAGLTNMTGPKPRPTVVRGPTPKTCAKAQNRKAIIAKKNAPQPEKKYKKMVLRQRSKLRNIQEKLDELGIPKLELRQGLLDEGNL